MDEAGRAGAGPDVTNNGAGDDGDNRAGDADRAMTLLEHLEELRGRLLFSAIAVAVTTILSLVFTTFLFDLMKQPLPEGVKLIYTAPTEMLGTYLKVAFYAGLVLAMPVLLYQFTAFVAPAMTKREKRYFFLLLPGIILCFSGGVTFGYKLVLPTALPYLLGLFGDIAEPLLKVGEYISFVSTFLFWLGVSFQTPLVIFLLAKLNVVTPERMSGMRKFAIVIAFLLAAFITPTPDPVNQTIVAVPIYLLFEVGLLLARFA